MIKQLISTLMAIALAPSANALPPSEQVNNPKLHRGVCEAYDNELDRETIFAILHDAISEQALDNYRTNPTPANAEEVKIAIATAIVAHQLAIRIECPRHSEQLLSEQEQKFLLDAMVQVWFVIRNFYDY